jgi:hypothetical protein
VDHPVPASFAAGFSLMGMDSLPQASAPGETLTFRLFWRIDRPLSADQLLVVSLAPAPASSTAAGSAGKASSGKQPAILGASSAVTVTIPRAIPAAQFVHTYVDLRLQPGLSPGAQELWLSLPDGSSARRLGTVNVAGRPRQFTLPSEMRPLAGTFGPVAPSGLATVALVGISTIQVGTEEHEVPATGSVGVAPNKSSAGDRVVLYPGQSLSFDLAWRVDDPPTEDLVRFVHLVGADGRPLAQQDAPPCLGACPALSWLRGEFLTDPVKLTLPSDIPPGSYRLAAGWYSADTLQRLPATDAAGAPAPGDLLVLPVTIVVNP